MRVYQNKLKSSPERGAGSPILDERLSHNILCRHIVVNIRLHEQERPPIIALIDLIKVVFLHTLSLDGGKIIKSSQENNIFNSFISDLSGLIGRIASMADEDSFLGERR